MNRSVAKAIPVKAAKIRCATGRVGGEAGEFVSGMTLSGVLGRDRVEVDTPLRAGDSLRSKIKNCFGALRRHDRVPEQR